MANRIFYSSPEAIRSMIENLRTLADTSTESIEKLRKWLEQQDGFVSDSSLIDVISVCFPNDEQGSAVFNTLQNLNADDLDQALETIQVWRNSRPKNAQDFSDEQLLATEARLRNLVRNYPALNRTRKAKRLRVVLGNELKGVAFICDARPVFDEERDHIEGLISVTTMKLFYERQNLDGEEIEITLSAGQLDQLIEEAEKARKKLRVMKASIGEWLPAGQMEDCE